jgi:hypothetical protein
MPKDILEKPNEKHFEKAKKEIEDQIEHHKKSIVN